MIDTYVHQPEPGARPIRRHPSTSCAQTKPDNAKAERSRAVWSQTYLDCYQRALKIARRRVVDLNDAEDCVADSYVRILRLVPDPDKIKNPRSYLHSVVKHVCIDYMLRRKLAAERVVSIDSSSDDLDNDSMPLRDLPSAERDPEMNAEINEENRRLLTLLESHCGDLTERENALLSLRLQDFSNDQIANTWQENVTTIRADMNALLAKIRYRLQHSKHKNDPRKIWQPPSD